MLGVHFEQYTIKNRIQSTDAVRKRNSVSEGSQNQCSALRQESNQAQQQARLTSLCTGNMFLALQMRTGISRLQIQGSARDTKRHDAHMARETSGNKEQCLTDSLLAKQ